MSRKDCSLYYLMSIHEQPPRTVKKELKQVGGSKAAELAKVAAEGWGQRFDCANWLHKAQELPTQQFKVEVDGRDGRCR